MCKVGSSSLVTVVMLVLLALVGSAGLDDVQAQRSCDSVISLVKCSEDSNGAADGDNDGYSKNDDDSEGNSADIESKIPSTAGIGVPFP